MRALFEMNMSSTFWWGIVLGGGVGFLASIVANLSTPSFASYFSRSKAGWIERGKKRALKQLTYVQRFRNGAEDKYMYFAAQWGYILLFSTMSALLLIMVCVQPYRAFPLLLDGWMLFVALLGLAYAFWISNKLHLWYWRMNNFEEYRASLLKKWSDLDLDE